MINKIYLKGKKFKYIYHLADIHVFNSKRHNEFIDVFKTGLCLQSVKLWETPSSYALYEVDGRDRS